MSVFTEVGDDLTLFKNEQFLSHCVEEMAVMGDKKECSFIVGERFY